MELLDVLVALNIVGLIMLGVNLIVLDRMEDRDKAHMWGLILNAFSLGFYVGGLFIYLVAK